jgi:serine/threonine-protein kinase HipA
MKSLLLNWLLAAPDAHAKNFSIFHNPGGTYRLTPFYDLMSAYPVLGTLPGRIPAQKLKMAMAIRTKHPHYHHMGIGRRHWIEMGMEHGFSEMEMNNMMDQVIETVPTVSEELLQSLPAGFTFEVFDAITTGMLKTANRLK